jgi:hypothetical protein
MLDLKCISLSYYWAFKVLKQPAVNAYQFSFLLVRGSADSSSSQIIGTVSWDISSPVFPPNKFSPAQYVDTSRNNLEFFLIFVELSVFVVDTPVMNTLGSRSECLVKDKYFKLKSYVLSSSSNLQSIFSMIVPLKVVVCSLKSVKYFPLCPKRHPGDEYLWESWLPCGEYTGKSQLLGSKYTW